MCCSEGPLRIFWPKSLHDVRNGDFGFFIATRIPGVWTTSTDCLNRNKHGRKTNLRNTGLPLCDTAIERGFAASMDTSTRRSPPEKRWIGNLKNTAMRKILYLLPVGWFRLPACARQYTRGTFDLAGAVRRLSVRRFHFGTGGDTRRRRVGADGAVRRMGILRPDRRLRRRRNAGGRFHRQGT